MANAELGTGSTGGPLKPSSWEAQLWGRQSRGERKQRTEEQCFEPDRGDRRVTEESLGVTGTHKTKASIQEEAGCGF